MRILVRICIIVTLVVVSTLVTPPASAAIIVTPDERCMVVGYAVGHNRNHISMIDNNTIQFGTSVVIESDCVGGFNVSLDGGVANFVPEGGVWFSNVSALTRSITVQGDQWSINWSGLSFWGGGHLDSIMTQYVEQQTPRGEYWTLADIRSHDFMVGLVTVLIALVVSLGFVNKLTKFYVERQVGTEITEGWA